MFKLRYLIPALMLLGALPAASQAQSSVPLTTTTYSVQVQKEYWMNGNTYWTTVFQTEDREEAELMLAVLEFALDNGMICEILNCEFGLIIRDVRMTSRTVWNIVPIDRAIVKPSYLDKIERLPLRR